MISEIADYNHESPYILLMVQNLKDIGNFIEKEIEVDPYQKKKEKLPEPIIDMINTYLKICFVYEVLCFNNLNQILVHMVQAPRVIMTNLMKISCCLDNFGGE